MELIDLLALPNKKDYLCYEVLKDKLSTDEKFREAIVEGLKEGKISGFDHSMWDKINAQNVRARISFDEAFKRGYNVGSCTRFSLQYSYSLDNCEICGGTLPLIAGTYNSQDGSHTWISADKKIIDTTLMLVIDESYAKKIGYIEERRDNPNYDSRYCAAKDYTNDPELRRKK